MAKASVDFFSPDSMGPSQPTAADISADGWSVNNWLDQLLAHFSVQQLDTISTQEIASYLAKRLEKSDTLKPEKLKPETLEPETNQASSQAVSLRSYPSNSLDMSNLAAELKRRVMRLAGVKLDSAFLSMASHVVDETAVRAVSLTVEGRKLNGVRYQGDVYRQVNSFKLCHQLQAYCLAQTLSEQHVQYLLTRSAHQFVVWASIRTFPKQSNRTTC